MPRVLINKAEDQAKDAINNLKWECKKYGFSQEQQAELCGCTPQNICKAYKNQSLSARQYLLITARLDEIKQNERG
jgi:hypothetical protein